MMDSLNSSGQYHADSRHINTGNSSPRQVPSQTSRNYQVILTDMAIKVNSSNLMLPNQSLVADLTYLEIGGCYITHLILAVYEANRTVTGNPNLLKAQGYLTTAHI